MPASTTAPPAESTATPIPVPTPPPTFAGFPGWLGLATVEGHSDFDAPSEPVAHVALPEYPQAWAALAGQKKLAALAPGFSDEVAFFGTHEIAFGCDGGKSTFAFFKGTRRPAQGAVWLVPPGTAASIAPLDEIPAAKISAAIKKAGPKDLRAWRVGDRRTFVSRRTDKSITSEIWEGETRVFRDEVAWRPMAGGDAVPPTLAAGPAVPIPERVLVSGTASLLVIQTHGFEGTNFRAIHLSDGAARRAEGGLYLYWCAF